MAKKSKGNKQKSARGHVEGNTIRYREETKKIRYRIGPDGKPLKDSGPLNLFDKNWLAGKGISDLVAPPVYAEPMPIPSNVTSIADARKKRDDKVSKPVSRSGNEAEAIKHTYTTKHGWLHDKALAIGEFKSWERQTKEIGRRLCGSPPWIVRNGKLSSPVLEAAREAAQNGHKGLQKVRHPRQKKIEQTAEHGGYAVETQHSGAITTHNQRNAKRLDPKFYMPPVVTGSAGLAPSGIPIRVFTEGGKYAPPESSVVRTTELPPTPTRDWRAGPDSNTRAEPITVSINSWRHKTRGMVQWFINHVEPQNWPTSVHNFVRWKDGGPIVNSGAINEAVSHPETELLLVQSLNEGLEKDWRMLDSALADANSENSILRQELEITKRELESEKNERLSLEYQLAQQTGDVMSLEEIRSELSQRNVIKSKSPLVEVPDDIDLMLIQFRQFRAFERVYSPEEAFARYVYNDPTLGKVMRDHADMKCAERQAEVGYRNLVRTFQGIREHIFKQHWENVEQKKREEYTKLWETQYPTYLRNKLSKVGAVKDAGKDAVSYAAMSRKSKPALLKPSSTYYSTFKRISGSETTQLWNSEHGSAVQSVGVYDGVSFRDREVNSAVAKAITSKLRPTQLRYNNPHCVEDDNRESWAQPVFRGVHTYEKWWADRIDYLELEYQKKKHPVKVGLVKAINKAIDVLNTPIDPITRSKNAKLREKMREEQRQLDEKRESRAEERKAAKERRRKLKFEERQREIQHQQAVEAKRAAEKQRKAEREHIKKMQRLAH